MEKLVEFLVNPLIDSQYSSTLLDRLRSNLHEELANEMGGESVCNIYIYPGVFPKSMEKASRANRVSLGAWIRSIAMGSFNEIRIRVTDGEILAVYAKDYDSRDEHVIWIWCPSLGIAQVGHHTYSKKL